MIIFLFVISLLAIILIVGKINLSIQFSKQVKIIFFQSKNISSQKFKYSQLDSLPEPVQRYFKHSLIEDQHYISYMRIIHDGQFKTGIDKDWINIKGEQYITTESPGFIWKGTNSMFIAREMYLEDKGRLTVSLFSIITIVDGKGDQYNQGEPT